MFWAEYVQAWQTSGQSQVAYCQQHELKPRALAYWIRHHKQSASPLPLVPLAVQGPSAVGELLLQHASGWQFRPSLMQLFLVGIPILFGRQAGPTPKRPTECAKLRVTQLRGYIRE